MLLLGTAKVKPADRIAPAILIRDAGPAGGKQPVALPRRANHMIQFTRPLATA